MSTRFIVHRMKLVLCFLFIVLVLNDDILPCIYPASLPFLNHVTLHPWKPKLLTACNISKTMMMLMNTSSHVWGVQYVLHINVTQWPMYHQRQSSNTIGIDVSLKAIPLAYEFPRKILQLTFDRCSQAIRPGHSQCSFGNSGNGWWWMDAVVK